MCPVAAQMHPAAAAVAATVKAIVAIAAVTVIAVLGKANLMKVHLCQWKICTSWLTDTILISSWKGLRTSSPTWTLLALSVSSSGLCTGTPMGPHIHGVK